MRIGSKQEFALEDGTRVIAFRINENEHQFTLTASDGAKHIYYHLAVPPKNGRRNDDITVASPHWPQIDKRMGDLGLWLV